MKKLKYLIPILVLTALSFGLSSCNSDAEVKGTGEATVKMTDAAVDAENVSGVYMRVNEVQARSGVSSRTIATFDQTKEFDLMAYQNGNTYLLGDGELRTGNYNQIRLILDEANPAYVKMKDGSSKAISLNGSSSSTYDVSGNIDILANSNTDIVVDVDLRKALVLKSNGEYILRSNARAIDAAATGTVEGTMNNSADKVVVYAYAKGTYTASEAEEPADGRARFENSVNSAVVSSLGNYKLSFMEEGEYELVVAEYNEEPSGEDYDFNAAARGEMSVNGTVTDFITVSANSTVIVNLSLQ